MTTPEIDRPGWRALWSRAGFRYAYKVDGDTFGYVKFVSHKVVPGIRDWWGYSFAVMQGAWFSSREAAVVWVEEQAVEEMLRRG